MRTKLLVLTATALLIVSGTALASDRFSFSLNIGGPAYVPAEVVQVRLPVAYPIVERPEWYAPRPVIVVPTRCIPPRPYYDRYRYNYRWERDYDRDDYRYRPHLGNWERDRW